MKDAVASRLVQGGGGLGGCLHAAHDVQPSCCIGRLPLGSHGKGLATVRGRMSTKEVDEQMLNAPHAAGWSLRSGAAEAKLYAKKLQRHEPQRMLAALRADPGTSVWHD